MRAASLWLAGEGEPVSEMYPSSCATGCIVSVRWSLPPRQEEYEGLGIVVNCHRDDGPGVFRVVPMIDDGRKSRGHESLGQESRMHFTMLATQVLFDVKEEWSKREFSCFRELFRTVIEMGQEHAKRCKTTINATVPIPPVQGHKYVFAVLKFNNKGVLKGLDLADAETRKSIPWHRIPSKKSVLHHLQQQDYWSMPCPNFHNYLPPLGQGDPWFGDWGVEPADNGPRDPVAADGLVPAGAVSGSCGAPSLAATSRQDMEASFGVLPGDGHVGIVRDERPAHAGDILAGRLLSVAAVAVPSEAREKDGNGEPAATPTFQQAGAAQPPQVPEQAGGRSRALTTLAQRDSSVRDKMEGLLCTAGPYLDEIDVEVAAKEAARLKDLFATAKLELSRALQDQAAVSRRWSEVLARPPDAAAALQDVPTALDQEVRDAQHEIERKRAAAAAAHHVLGAAMDVAKRAEAAYSAQMEARRSRRLALEAHEEHTRKLHILQGMLDSPLVQRSLAQIRARMAAGPEHDAELTRWEALEREAKKYLAASQCKLWSVVGGHGLEQASFSESSHIPPSLEWQEHRDRRVRQRHS